MTKEKYYIAAWWRKRKVSKKELAKKIEHFLSKLREVDKQFINLYKLGKSISRPVGSVIGNNIPEIMQNIDEDDLFPSVGFMYWTLLKDESICIQIREGSYSPNLSLPNNLFIEFRIASVKKVIHFLTVDNIKGLLEAVTEVFDPLWAGMFSTLHRERLGLTGGVPFASWMLALPKPIETIPAMPDDVIVQKINNWGTLIITVRELFDVNNEHHLKIASEVNDRLHCSGLLDDISDDQK